MQNIKYELDLWNRGIRYIAGVDEVGRGPLAGPFVVGAVILDLEKIIQTDKVENTINNDVKYKKNIGYTDIKDSKLISENKRCKIAEFIRIEAISYSIIEIDSIELDSIGMSKATQKGFFESIKRLKIKPDHILTDSFEIKALPKEYQTNIISGDKLSITIGAASILAKTYRDSLMVEMGNKYIQYGFGKHKGYGTKDHIERIKKHGICDIHRKSFEPIKSMIQNNDVKPN
jgi:ribonuclease HII